MVDCCSLSSVGGADEVDLSLFRDPTERSSGMASGVDSAVTVTYGGFNEKLSAWWGCHLT